MIIFFLWTKWLILDIDNVNDKILVSKQGHLILFDFFLNLLCFVIFCDIKYIVYI